MIVVAVIGILVLIFQFYLKHNDFVHQVKYKLRKNLFLIYYITVAFDALCLLISGIMLIIISRKLARLERNKFVEEKRWFWSLLSLFGIFIMQWVTELLYLSPFSFSSFSSSVILETIKLFGVINIFVMFIVREEVKNLLFKKYRGL